MLMLPVKAATSIPCKSCVTLCQKPGSSLCPENHQIYFEVCLKKKNQQQPCTSPSPQLNCLGMLIATKIRIKKYKKKLILTLVYLHRQKLTFLLQKYHRFESLCKFLCLKKVGYNAAKSFTVFIDKFGSTDALAGAMRYL